MKRIILKISNIHRKACVLLSFHLVSLLFLSCTVDSYETGEGPYSQMVADFADLYTDAQKNGISFVTDEGSSYTLTTPIRASWIDAANSIYRTSIYYNKVAEGVANPIACGYISVLQPKEPSEFKRQPQDPLGVESCWLSKNGKYLNLGLLVKNGRDNEGVEGSHALALVQDEIHLNDDNTYTIYYRLLHDKGDSPEYYTNRRYVSILLPEDNRPDSVRITITTYDGDYVKTIKL